MGRFSQLATLCSRLKKLKARADTDHWREIASALILRITAGCILIPHGLSQLLGGQQSIAAIALASQGKHPSTTASLLIIYLELIGGVFIAVGLFTRVFAAALAVEMLWAASLLWSRGGNIEDWQFPLALSAVMTFLTACGSGPYSVDRYLQRFQDSSS